MKPVVYPTNGPFGEWVKVRVMVFNHRTGERRMIWRGRVPDEETAIEMAKRDYAPTSDEALEVYQDNWYFGSQANH